MTFKTRRGQCVHMHVCMCARQRKREIKPCPDSSWHVLPHVSPKDQHWTLEPCLESALISPRLRATRLHTNRPRRHGAQLPDHIRSAQAGNLRADSSGDMSSMADASNSERTWKDRWSSGCQDIVFALTWQINMIALSRVRHWCQLSEVTPSSIQRQTDRALQRAAGMVKCVLRCETPGESYAEALNLSSIVDSWDKSLWQLGAEPKRYAPPTYSTAPHTAQEQAHEAVC